jgi:hypothetical protein
MKRLTLILGAAALAAISVPTPARAQSGCTWWDLTCNGFASAITDYGWHMTGRNPAGDVVYFRRLVDSNGNVVFDQARRDNYGRYIVVNNHTLRKGTVYGPNGEICKYSSNNKGYKEDCKYAKSLKVRAIKYEPAKVKPVHYEVPKSHTIKYKAPKVQHVDYKAHEGKDETKAVKGPKH